MKRVAVRILGVPENVVVLRRPALRRPSPIVIPPDDLVLKALPTPNFAFHIKDLIQHHLAVVDLAEVDVEEQRPRLRHHPLSLFHPWPHKPAEVVEAVSIP